MNPPPTIPYRKGVIAGSWKWVEGTGSFFGPPRPEKCACPLVDRHQRLRLSTLPSAGQARPLRGCSCCRLPLLVHRGTGPAPGKPGRYALPSPLFSLPSSRIVALAAQLLNRGPEQRLLRGPVDAVAGRAPLERFVPVAVGGVELGASVAFHAGFVPLPLADRDLPGLLGRAMANAAAAGSLHFVAAIVGQVLGQSPRRARAK